MRAEGFLVRSLNLISGAIWKGNILFQLSDLHVSYPGYSLQHGKETELVTNILAAW